MHEIGLEEGQCAALIRVCRGPDGGGTPQVEESHGEWWRDEARRELGHGLCARRLFSRERAERSHEEADEAVVQSGTLCLGKSRVMLRVDFTC